MKKIVSLLALSLVLLASCQKQAAVPTESTPTTEVANIYPDYRNIVIPPNIAPLNFQIKSAGTAFVASVSGAKGTALVTATGADGKIMMDSKAWSALLEANKGDSLHVSLYAQQSDGRWLAYPRYTLHIAPEPIDRYLSYRLIEPGYELYRQLGLYQRDLQTFDEHTIYENNRSFSEKENHCINCHNYQAYDTRRMLFHVRATHGGTVVTDGEKIEKLNMKHDSILSTTVYPTWHPTRPWIVFSSNQTGQAFHLQGPEKIEVIDYGSDLVFYDADTHTLTNMLKTEDYLETFPCWAPDGKKLYYCSVYTPVLQGKESKRRSDIVLSGYDKWRYNLMSLTFDEQTRSFGAPQLELACDSMGKSVSVPRVSPDGRYLLFTLGDYGQFHIWHNSSDLYIKDLHTGQVRPLTQTNSLGVDSYHTWSSNGRWIVFSSRRDDATYTRPYIAYFDPQGRDYKAFILPQLDPEHNLMLLKSYNVPELTRNPVQISSEQFKEVIYNDDATRTVTYK